MELITPRDKAGCSSEQVDYKSKGEQEAYVTYHFILLLILKYLPYPHTLPWTGTPHAPRRAVHPLMGQQAGRRGSVEKADDEELQGLGRGTCSRQGLEKGLQEDVL